MKGLVIGYRLLDLYVGDSGAAAVLDVSVTVGDVLSRAPRSQRSFWCGGCGSEAARCLSAPGRDACSLTGSTFTLGWTAVLGVS